MSTPTLLLSATICQALNEKQKKRGQTYTFDKMVIKRSGCRVTKSRRSQNESAKLSGATGLPVELHLRHG